MSICGGGGGWQAASPAAVNPTTSAAGSSTRHPRQRFPPRSTIRPSCPRLSCLCTEGLLAAVLGRALPPVGQVQVGPGLQLLVGRLLDGDERVVGGRLGPQQLVELALGG